MEPWQRRLYFVRLPKPQQDDHSTELRQLEQELEAFKTQTQLLNESINIRKVGCVVLLAQAAPPWMPAQMLQPLSAFKGNWC